MSHELTKLARLAIEKSPPEWFDLPAEMRKMVIDNMNPKTRCKFAQCSRICEKEAKASKNYLVGIGICRGTHPELLIGHGLRYLTYSLEFVDVANLTQPQTIIIYKTNMISKDRKRKLSEKPGILKWTKIVPGKAEDIRMKHLDEILEKYHKTIKNLYIDDEMFPINKYSMKHLIKLININVEISTDVLKTGILGLTQILRGDLVSLKKTKFSFDQVLQFEGRLLQVTSDEFGLENIKKYLRMWKNGEINKNMRELSVHDEKRELYDVQDIIEGLNVYDFCEEPNTYNGYESIFSFDFNHKRNDNYYIEVKYSTGCFQVHIRTDFK